MRTALYLSAVLLSIGAFLPFDAHARPGRCGYVDRDIVRDVFRAVDRVDFYFDIEDSFKDICRDMEMLRERERGDARSAADKSYKRERDHIITEMEGTMRALAGSLTALRGWIHHDPDGAVERTRRTVRIRDSKRDIARYMASLRFKVEALRNLHVPG